MLISASLGYIWIHYLDLPTDPIIVSQYVPSVCLICLAVTMESLNEVFWNVTQVGSLT